MVVAQHEEEVEFFGGASGYAKMIRAGMHSVHGIENNARAKQQNQCEDDWMSECAIEMRQPASGQA